MPKFLTDVEVRKVAHGDEYTEFEWELMEPLVYASSLVIETLVVPKGFQTDFASVPRLPLAYLLTGDKVHAPAVVHDWLIRTKRVPRPLADKIFLEAMQADGVSSWRRYLMYAAVASYTAWLNLLGKLPSKDPATM